MLAPKCATYNGRSTFANPKYLKIAQSEKPCLYEIPYDTSDPANRFCPNREDTVTLEKESRSKLNKDTVKPYDYTYQNSLYEIFKPPSKTYLDQLERAKEVRKTMWRKTFVRTKPNIAKNVAFLPVGIPTGKLFNSCTGKVDSEPTHGSIVDIPHIHACKQTLGLSAGKSFNGQKQQRIDLNADALYNAKQENLRVWLLKMLISKKPVPECSDLAPQRQMVSAENNTSGPVPQCSNDVCSHQFRPRINPMIQPEPEDLPKDNPKLEIAVLRDTFINMDKSWMETNRISKSYVDGVAAFTDYAVHNLQKTGNIDPRVNKKHIYIPCPCTKCLNHIEHKVEEVQYHLYRHGIDISYTKWTKHGEEDEPSISAPKPVNATTEFVDDMDFAYIPTDGPATVEMVNATKDNFDVDDLVKFQELLLDAEKPLYEGCPDFTKLSAIVKLLNLKGKYKASDKFFTELLGLIKKMLHAGNEMKNDKDLTACRTCGTSRWKVDNKTKKVYENIPAKMVCYVTPEIAKDTRNLRLGISADGVDVNTGNRHHSVWPVLTIIYNLPPWLCMKIKFINHSVLISGYPRNDIDVFLEPLVDDLHFLFETGVDTYDASTKDNFNLCAVVLWTINDYPALGTLCGCPYSGFKGCVVCGKDTNCVRLSASSKQSYVGHRRYLPYNHPFRKQKKAFNGQQEFLQAPIPMTGEQIYNE
ncbi:putative transposase-associated domain-containing protein, partial [Tanacetum coccineum]